MPKGKASAFQPYKRRGGDVQAQVIEQEQIKVGDETFVQGDYLLLDNGEIVGAHKEDFEKIFEPLKKAWPKKKKKAVTGEGEGAVAEGAVAGGVEAVAVS